MRRCKTGVCNPHPAPSVTEPESFHANEWRLPLRCAPLSEAQLSRVSHVPERSVLPERFRGGCSFGGEASPALSRYGSDIWLVARFARPVKH